MMIPNIIIVVMIIIFITVVKKVDTMIFIVMEIAVMTFFATFCHILLFLIIVDLYISLILLTNYRSWYFETC